MSSGTFTILTGLLWVFAFGFWNVLPIACLVVSVFPLQSRQMLACKLIPLCVFGFWGALHFISHYLVPQAKFEIDGKEFIEFI